MHATQRIRPWFQTARRVRKITKTTAMDPFQLERFERLLKWYRRKGMSNRLEYLLSGGLNRPPIAHLGSIVHRCSGRPTLA